jgi:uncharacterized protein YaiL (DUF2058 family)
MSNSLQDQLLALGIAKEKPSRSSGKDDARKPRAIEGERNAKSRPSARRKDPAGEAHKSPEAVPTSPESISLEQAYRIRETEEKSAKQKARDRKMEEDRRRAAINRQLREIVDAGRLNLADASEPRYFMYKGRIRKVYASAEQLDGLNTGTLGVVYLAGSYHILSSVNMEAIRLISPEHVVDLLSGASDEATEQLHPPAGQNAAGHSAGTETGELVPHKEVG